MVLTIPNVLSSMNKAKNEAMVTFAKKVRKASQEYAFVHQDEFTREYITKDITEIMGDSGNYEGTVLYQRMEIQQLNHLNIKTKIK